MLILRMLKKYKTPSNCIERVHMAFINEVHTNLVVALGVYSGGLSVGEKVQRYVGKLDHSLLFVK